MKQGDKDNLSYLYESEHYKSFRRMNEAVRKDILEKLSQVDMSTVGADKTIAFLQGQAFALRSQEAKLKDIHKRSMKD